MQEGKYSNSSLKLLLIQVFFFPAHLIRPLSPTPSSRSNLSLRPCCYLSMVARSSNQGSVDAFRLESTEIQLRDWRPLICSRCKGVLKQDHEWKAELSWSPSIYHGAVSRTSARLSNRNIREVSTWGRGRDRCPLCFCLVFYCYFLSNDKQN